jgi:hypothetical protein
VNGVYFTWNGLEFGGKAASGLEGALVDLVPMTIACMPLMAADSIST